MMSGEFPCMLLQRTGYKMATSRMPNAVERAKPIAKKSRRFRRASGNIAAIDFGTKNCSLAYVTEGDAGLAGPLNKLPLNDNSCRVPTAILLSDAREVLDFGTDARRHYSDLDSSQKEKVYFFDSIKVNLQQDKDVKRDMAVKSLNGRSLPLVEVIASILGYLRRELLERYLPMSGHNFTAEDFDWVVTVPAIWLASGKQMMREAARKAGLCSELDPDQLSLALEPESGAIYCHEMRKRKQVAYPNPASHTTSPPSSYSYLIVDIGGGTVDISAHQVSTSPSLSVHELHHPVGNGWGGLQVNKTFSEFLQKMVGDRLFSRYLHGNATTRAANRFDLDELINDTFESRKRQYCRNPTKEVVVKLPDSFLNMYRGALVTLLEGQAKQLHVEGRDREAVSLRESQLRIPPARMEQFFQPSLQGVFDCVDSLLASLLHEGHRGVDTIYLVGGFGGCQYMYTAFRRRYGDIVFVPPHPEFAIVEGAVMFRRDPAVVRSRKADATYGKSVMRYFESFHDDRYRDGQFCKHLFQTIVSVGERVRADCFYVTKSRPLTLDQRKMHIEVYSSKRKAEELRYTRDEGVVLVGELELELPEVGRLVRDRVVEILFDFSHTEIQVKARDKSSHTEVKAVLDFLSAIPAEQHGRLPATVTGEGELLVGSGEQEHDVGESSVSE